MKTVALIVAGGSSERFGGELPKQFVEIAGKPLLSHTIQKFEDAESITEIVLVVAEDYLQYTTEHIIDPFNFHKVVKVVSGGDTRRQSVLNGLDALSTNTQFVAIHDAARPLVSVTDINKVVQVAQKENAAILATQEVDTIKLADGNHIEKTLDRKKIYSAQTPQVFAFTLIKDAHQNFKGDESAITDDASLLELEHIKVTLVEASPYNFKITTQSDLLLAEMILQKEQDE